ncbi:MAG TPA: nucleotide sugar dehydrogenase [Candidatus Paceibacterota bacterium]|nr:nucleotide sugar dehydrogenase [Candidatus Paceibacterota bacterium]
MNKTIGTQVISVVGLGKLGACIAACLASRGFKVLGYDANEKVTLLLNGGKAPVAEPGLDELIGRFRKNISATMKPEEIIEKTDITFIIVPTPSKKDGNFADKFLKDVLTKLAPAIKEKKGHHLFVINSTVSPQTTERSLIPLIEKLSSKKLNERFSVCYKPEFIALGDVINGILNPDLVLIGEGNVKAGDVLEKIYKKLCNNKPYIARMSIVSAEIMKIALNSYVTMKISYANMLGNICERIPGANVDDITRALGADKRISPHYLKAGLTFGGPCFPRDNRAFQAFAKRLGLRAIMAEATDKVHHFQTENLTVRILEVLKSHNHDSISVLGLSYKPKTGVIDESPAVKLICNILERNAGIKISVYDHLAQDNARKFFSDRIDYAPTIKECLNRSKCWVLATPEKDYVEISTLHALENEGTIIDCWRVLDYTKLKKHTHYLSPGGNLYENSYYTTWG